MKRVVETLMDEYPEIFKEICSILNLPVSDFIESYSDSQIESIMKTLKREYRNIFKEL